MQDLEEISAARKALGAFEDLGKRYGQLGKLCLRVLKRKPLLIKNIEGARKEQHHRRCFNTYATSWIVPPVERLRARKPLAGQGLQDDERQKCLDHPGWPASI